MTAARSASDVSYHLDGAASPTGERIVGTFGNVTVSFDEKSGLVLVELEGFWNVDIVQRFADQAILALQQARAATGKGLVLSDARKLPVQRSEVGQAFATADIRMGPLRDKMAMLVGSALSKLQGQRALSGTVTEFFSDEKAARAWLRE